MAEYLLEREVLLESAYSVSWSIFPNYKESPHDFRFVANRSVSVFQRSDQQRQKWLQAHRAGLRARSDKNPHSTNLAAGILSSQNI